MLRYSWADGDISGTISKLVRLERYDNFTKCCRLLPSFAAACVFARLATIGPFWNVFMQQMSCKSCGFTAYTRLSTYHVYLDVPPEDVAIPDIVVKMPGSTMVFLRLRNFEARGQPHWQSAAYVVCMYTF